MNSTILALFQYRRVSNCFRTTIEGWLTKARNNVLVLIITLTTIKKEIITFFERARKELRRYLHCSTLSNLKTPTLIKLISKPRITKSPSNSYLRWITQRRGGNPNALKLPSLIIDVFVNRIAVVHTIIIS